MVVIKLNVQTDVCGVASKIIPVKIFHDKA